MKISIVIPVYNVEQYIEKCILSCCNQNINKNDYEIILINDGSTDSSEEIIKRIIPTYSNVTLISQENSGLSVARNTGLELAKGDYVWFVDSDDYIEENCLEAIVADLSDDVDLLQIQYSRVYESTGEVMPARRCLFNDIKCGKDVFLSGGLSIPAQFTIYKKSFLLTKKLFFYPGIYHEDTEFKPRATILASKVKTSMIHAYYYLQRKSGSITSNYKVKNARDVLFVCNRLIDFSRDYDSSIQSTMANVICMNFNNILIGLDKLNKKDKEEVIAMIQQNQNVIRYITKASILKYRIEGYMLRINLNLTRRIYLNNRPKL